MLAELDVVVASAHQRLAIDEAENTKRIIRAAENRYVHMLGHLTGRLLLGREAQKVNVNAVIEACAATGTWIELMRRRSTGHGLAPLALCAEQGCEVRD